VVNPSDNTDSSSRSFASREGGSTIDALKSFLETRYDASSQFLNLEEMGKDHNLSNLGIRGLGDPRSPSSFGPVLLKLISEQYPQVNTLLFLPSFYVELVCL
jgi:hypothetical protein